MNPDESFRDSITYAERNFADVSTLELNVISNNLKYHLKSKGMLNSEHRDHGVRFTRKKGNELIFANEQIVSIDFAFNENDSGGIVKYCTPRMREHAMYFTRIEIVDFKGVKSTVDTVFREMKLSRDEYDVTGDDTLDMAHIVPIVFNPIVYVDAVLLDDELPVTAPAAAVVETAATATDAAAAVTVEAPTKAVESLADMFKGLTAGGKAKP